MSVTASIQSAPSCGNQERFVAVDGVRLQLLDWGGSGPALILIHGGMDNPHAFEDLAPAFTDRFRVIAYARRGHGDSDVRGPYDSTTLTQDLLGVMNALHLGKAHLVGWSMGGNEVTGLAVSHPERVDRIVYLDGAFDFADPAFRVAFKSVPTEFMQMPSSAMASIEAYRDYYQREVFAPLQDMRRVERYLRDLVTVQEDGRVKLRMSPETQEAVLAAVLADPPKQYHRICCPALAIFPESQFNLHGANLQRRALALECERKYMVPLRRKFMDQLRRELMGVRIMSVPGAHSDFFLNAREQVVGAMREFLMSAG